MVAAILALWAALNVLSANPAKVPTEVPTIEHPVTDLVGVLSPRAKDDIARELVAHRDATGVQLAVLIVSTTHGRDIADYAQAVFDRWGGGSKERNDGALFVLAIADRRNRLHLGYGLEPVIADATAKRMLDSLRPALVAGDYEGATRQLVRAVKDRTAFLTPGEPIAPPLGARRFAWVIVLVLGTGIGIFWGHSFTRGWRAYKTARRVGETAAGFSRACAFLVRQRRLQLALAALALGQLALALTFSAGHGYVLAHSLVYWHFIGVGWLIGGSRKGAMLVGTVTALALFVAIALAGSMVERYVEPAIILAYAGGVAGFVWVLSLFSLPAVLGGGGEGGYSSSYSSSSYSGSSSWSSSSSSYSGSSSWSSSSSSSYSYSGGGGSSGGGGASSSW